jgi:hypothetical protein
MRLSAASTRPLADSKRLAKNNSSEPSSSPKPTHALLSIRPPYASAIFGGTKRFEFRRMIFREPVKSVVVYVTTPVCRVWGEFDVDQVIEDKVRNCGGARCDPQASTVPHSSATSEGSKQDLQL